MNKGAIGIDFIKSMCARLTKFSYGPASTPSQTNLCGNVPVQCTHCPKGSSAVWKYNLEAHYHAKHSPTPPPTEFMITDFEVEGLKSLWNNRYTTNQMEVRFQKHLRPHFTISKAHSTQLTLCTTDLEEPNGNPQGLKNQDGPEQHNEEINCSSTEPNHCPQSLCCL